MRIVLVAIHPYPSPQAIPLSNALLKSAAASCGVAIELRDFFVDQAPELLASELLSRGPVAAIGFSLYAWNRTLTVATLAALRRRHPELLLFCGGPEATADPHGLLREAPCDAVVVGEGEAPFAALCRRLSTQAELAGIPGLLLRGREKAFVAQTSAVALADIPSPWLSGVLDAGQAPGILWQLARGCSFGCEFCYDARDRFGVRRLPLERVEAELRHFVSRGVRQVFVLDSTFNQDLPRAKAILRLIKQLTPAIHFHFEVRSEFLDRELAGLFAEISCSLQIGLQSADPAVLKSVGRSFKREDFITKVGLLNQSGATFGFDLMIGLPGDTLPGVRASLDFALSLYPNQLDIFPLALLPGTPLAARAAELGLQHLPRPPYTVTATPTFSPAELEQARQLAMACDLFYSRGKAVAWFNGVVKGLNTTPAGLLADFAAWLQNQLHGKLPEPAACSDAQIYQWQRAYLSSRYSGKLHKQQGIVLDLLDYHHHYAQAVQTPPLQPVRLPKGAALHDRPWRLAVGVRLVPFRYDILALLDAGEPQPRRFSEQFPPQPCTALIFNTPRGVQTEVLDEAYIRLLRQLDGMTPVGQLAARLKIDRRELGEFLRIAAAAGLII